MNCRKPVPSPEDLVRAEKQVLAGVYGRLLARYVMRYSDSFASDLAMAVAKYLLSYDNDDEKAHEFLEQNREQVMEEINALKEDTVIRRIVTDTLVLKVVFQHKGKGCKDDNAGASLEELKKTGIYLEAPTPPTPGTFVRMAGKFFSETPLRAPVPPLTV